MDGALQAQHAALGDEVVAAAIPEGCKQTAAWCIGQLPTLYGKFRQTCESRYGEEISRLVQWLLKELTTSQQTCPEAHQLAARYRPSPPVLPISLAARASWLRAPWSVSGSASWVFD
jgi:hypothetical protein